MSNNIAFRADASLQIGSGHVIRCLTLADELTRQGFSCFFICREHKGHLGDLIISRGHRLILLPGPVGDAQKHNQHSSTSKHASWLGVPWHVDADQTLDTVSSLNPEWLIVDHYTLDARWERSLSSAAGKIMVIDDLADRPHFCDALLNQNLLRQSKREKYKQLVNKDCILMLGPSYALLRPEYAELAKSLPQRDGCISRVLVFVGGSDPYHLTEKYIRALSKTEYQHLFVDVVIGKNHPSPSLVKNLAEARIRTRVYSDLPSLAALMVRADLMLGAGGSTNWERICLGLNSVIVSVADNQDEINKELSDRSYVNFIGKADNLDFGAILNMLRVLFENPEIIVKCSKKMRAAVDGLGCSRVVKLLVN